MENNKLRKDILLNQLKTITDSENLDLEEGEILFEPLGLAMFFEGDEEAA